MLLRQAGSCWIGQAPAKVNLFLRVIRRRTDGYHELETVMARVGLSDTLLFVPTTDAGVKLAVQMAYPRSLGALPVPETADNLVVQAAQRLKAFADASAGVKITLIKRVPAAAGLGGGSSDAATTLAALNHLWRIGLPLGELQRIAAELGSDVPFFLAESPVALCTGRGEQMQSLSPRLSLSLVLARPEAGLVTAAVYRECRPEPDGPTAGRLCDGLRGGAVGPVAQGLHNTLQTPAERLSPMVSIVRAAFERERFLAHQMTGSGTAYFGICANSRQARRMAARLRAAGIPWAIATSTLI